jgi:hypothetical protein
MGRREKEMRVKHGNPDKLPLICRMCKAGLVKYFCKVCPPLSAQNLPMTDDEAHALNVQMRYDEEAKGIISNVDPETRKYFIELKKQMDKDKKEQ